MESDDDVNGDNVSVNSAISGVNGDVYGMSAIGSGQVGGGASVHTAMSSVTDMHGGIGGGNFSPTMNQVPDADVKAVLKESVSESESLSVSVQETVVRSKDIAEPNLLDSLQLSIFKDMLFPK